MGGYYPLNMGTPVSAKKWKRLCRKIEDGLRGIIDDDGEPIRISFDDDQLTLSGWSFHMYRSAPYDPNTNCCDGCISVGVAAFIADEFGYGWNSDLPL